MKNSIIFYIIILIIIGSLNLGFSQTPFIEVLDPGQESLDSVELDLFNSVTGVGENSQKNLIRINPLQDYFLLDTLKLEIPISEIGEIAFTTVGSIYRNDSSYYWMGYNLDGSSFRMGLYETGYIGTMFVTENQTRYQFSSISKNYGVMIRYPDWKNIESTFGCISTGDDGDQEDYYPDEFEGPDTLQTSEERGSCDYNRIRVLVLHTENARFESIGLGVDINRVAENLIDELNVSIANTGIPRRKISFVLADSRLLTGFVEDDIEDDINILAQNQDAQQIRNDVLADVVILITNNWYAINDGIAGLAYDIRVKSHRAYAISTLNATINGFTGSHEIGHLIGTRHQRCSGCPTGCDPRLFSSYKGYTVGSNMRTIMHVNDCVEERVPVWSSSGAKFMGMSTGNNNNRNSGILKNRASKVSCFREGSPPGPPPPPLLIYYIEGPLFICPENFFPQYEVIYNDNIFNNPIFSWDMSLNGISNWIPIPGFIDLGEKITLTNPQNMPEFFVLRVTISDNSGNISSTTIPVRKKDEPYSCNVFQRIIENESNPTDLTSETILYPNPTSNEIFVTGISGNIQFQILSSAGGVMKNGLRNVKEQEEMKISLKEFPAGTYLLVLNEESNKRSTFKIVKK